MNTKETIEYLARQNAKGLYPKNEDDMNKDVPYIQVFKNNIGSWDIKPFNYETHDNWTRMNLYIQYFKHAIFPSLDKNKDISGFYNIELHDSYTYLNKPFKYKDVLTFSKFKSDIHTTLIPDPYMVLNWNDHKVTDNKLWSIKDPKVCFYGTTTGNRDPLRNRRINICLWALDKPFYDFKITKVAQMQEYDIINKVGLDKWRRISSHPVQIEDQLQNKFHFLTDGNTCKFDVWYFNTNTLNFKDESMDMLWYYPMMRNKEHFVEVNENNIENMRQYYFNNHKEAEYIIHNAKTLSSELFKPYNHMYYTTMLFDTIAENK
jgi:hypothetical protein